MLENSRIILFTRRFPYFKTEAFLEAEIQILAQVFDEIIIIPSEISNEVRSIPINVRVDDQFSICFQNKKKRILKTIFSSFFWYALLKHVNQLNNLKSIKHIFQFCSSVVTYNEYLKNYTFTEKDILYTYWFNEVSKSLIDLKKKKNVKVISRAHRYDIYEGISATPDFWPFRKEVLEKIDCVFSISQNGKQYMESKYNVLNTIKVSKLGVFDKGILAPETGLDEVYFVSVSRIDPMKRVQLIADTIVEFACQNPEKKIIWRHFGDGLDRNQIKASLPELINLTTILEGAIPNTEVYQFYELTKVSMFINLSSSEGIPVSIMEAQSFGIPVIATNVGGSGEIVQQATGKLLSENPTIQEVNQAMTEIINKNLSREEIKAVWNRNFNAQTNYQKFANDLKDKKF
jgi:glycosyltransferase involved in cell wall biosynthesis